MRRLSLRSRVTSLFLIIAASLLANAAFAHGTSGAANIQAHIGEYEKEIASMVDVADGIAADYAAGEPVADQIETLIEAWDGTEFHEALETWAEPLYPPVWEALGGMKTAVKKEAAPAEVRKWRDRFVIALHEGMGALKLAAARKGSAGPANDESDDRPTVAIIQDNLREVLELYRDGDAAKAKELIHQTYLQRFEGIEGVLIEQDAELVESLEVAFNATLPRLIEKRAPTPKVAEQIEAMNAKLDRARKLLEQAAEEQSSVF